MYHTDKNINQLQHLQSAYKTTAPKNIYYRWLLWHSYYIA